MCCCRKIGLESIPLQVRETMARLCENNFSAYLVGGVIRDIIQGKEPHDYDMATSATPAQVESLFPRVVPTGEKHGTVTIITGGPEIEVTTLRRDGIYSDCRRPESVQFTSSLKEDLSRRDFTINSLAADPEGNVYDFFGGFEDISDGIIRAVGDPGKRFREDALRMLRAIRFACQTGFVIEEKTLRSMRASRRLIARVSMERIREELSAILVSAVPHRGLELLAGSGLLGHILPELAFYARKSPEGEEDVFGQTLGVLKNTPGRLPVRLAALLYIVGEGCPCPERRSCRHHPEGRKDPAAEILNRLKYDRRTVRSVTALIRERIAGNHFSLDKNIKKFMCRVGTENLGDIFSLWRAVAVSSGLPEREAFIDRLEKKAGEIVLSKLPLQIKDLAVDGNDLKSLGIRPGREMGVMLGRLLDVVLEKPDLNDKKILLGFVREWGTSG